MNFNSFLNTYKSSLFAIKLSWLSVWNILIFVFSPQGIEIDQIDLRRDIAYNLSLIYQNSGNTGMAQKLLFTYCSI